MSLYEIQPMGGNVGYEDISRSSNLNKKLAYIYTKYGQCKAVSITNSYSTIYLLAYMGSTWAFFYQRYGAFKEEKDMVGKDLLDNSSYSYWHTVDLEVEKVFLDSFGILQEDLE